jgi:2-polyprenyl-3-methyl-5-hydroxy-6-metoxy-1,4-benzoquinol methylase
VEKRKNRGIRAEVEVVASAMRTAAEFNHLYASPDPWQISRSRFRDRVMRRSIAPFVAGKSVLELGCGEGHLSEVVFCGAREIKGVDISEVAIARASALNLPNARFQNSDFLSVSFRDYDVIAAIECLYYLTADEQDAFFAKALSEHAGKILILSAPIIGSNQHRRYFTHSDLMATFKRYGVELIESHNLNVYRQTPRAPAIIRNAAAALVRLPLGDRLLDLVPEGLIYQRLYIIRMM